MTQDIVEKYAQAIIDVGAEVDSHIDGDARIQTFTFNEAQLVAFVELVTRAERAEVEKWAKRKKRDTGNCICADDGSHYFCDGSYNEALDDLIAHLSDK